ncbi:transmembrane transport protein [Mycobacterium rhizamassiliense]|uniref:Transmembrane transport protein n=1 Tax=Mycobacterium rhizamassiliense TaxID=1841860 RepID=A0A2U3NZC5_9MYCO|nr:transmembrane transport protein [Mycobacterium rhizamassiliense]
MDLEISQAEPRPTEEDASAAGALPTNGDRPRHRRLVVPLTVRRQPSSMAVLLVAAFGAFLAFLDSTIVNIAFPNIQKSFPTYGISSLSWVLNAYNIVFAAFLVAAGKLADLLGRKRMFVWGVVLFTVASWLCAVAGTVEQLVAFRVLQGIGAALLVPASLALVVEGFDVARRAHGVGLWGAAAAIASGLGPPIGGAIVQVSNWRWAFLVNLPLGILAVLVARRHLVESRAPGVRRVPDLRGAVLLAASLGLLTLGLIKGPDWGWTGAGTVGSFVAAAVALVGFVLSSRHHPAPLIEPAYLRVQSFFVGNALTIVAGAGFYGYLLTHVLYLNNVWRYNLLETGLAVAPAALIAAVVAAVLGKVADRHGHRMIIVVGALIWAGSLVWYLQRVGTHPNFLADWLPGQVLQGIGVGATLPLLGSAALARIAKGGSYATASAVVSSSRQLGAVIGVAVLVVLIGTPARGEAVEALRRGWGMAAICFVAVAVGALLLGRTNHVAAADDEPPPVPRLEPRPPAPGAATTEPVSAGTADADLLESLPLFAGLSPGTLVELRSTTEELVLEASSYLFHEGDVADSLYVVRNGRLQVLQGDVVLRELGRGEVIGELALLTGGLRSASIKAVRDSTLVRLTKAQFDRIADARVLGALVQELATRLHQLPPPTTSHSMSSHVVVSVVGVDAAAPVPKVANGLLSMLCSYVRAVDPGRVDRDGLDRAERSADKVVLHAGVDDAAWRDFCLRVADRIVLVAGDPAPPSSPLPERAAGADLVLAGPTARQADRCAWEELLTPRSVHTVRPDGSPEELRPLAARIVGRSVGLVLGGGGARAFAHLGVLEELHAAGVVVDRIAGTSMGAIVGALAASGLDPASVDAYVYEYFIRTNPMTDFTVPVKGLTRGRRIPALLRRAYGGQVIEELPKEFRCVSVDLLARRAVVHRRGPLADAVGCSLRLPGIFPPYVYDGTLHVDGGVLDNLPVSALSGEEGPRIAVAVGFGGDASPASPTQSGGPPRVPGIAETLMRTMMMGSGLAAATTLSQADAVIRPSTRGVGLLEFHQIDQAREAGRIATRDALPEILAVLQR